MILNITLRVYAWYCILKLGGHLDMTRGICPSDAGGKRLLGKTVS